MIPKSFSATAIQVFEGCPARYKAEQIDRTPDLTNSAAALGTVDHATLEEWIVDGHYLADYDMPKAQAVLKGIYERHYWQHFSDKERFAEGYKMAEGWRQRNTDWTGREVLMTEDKRTFPLKTSIGEIPFTYIFDRLDKVERPDGGFDIEVIDYKTVGRPVQPDQLKLRIQPRAYGLAAQILYPDAERIWVGFDLLRYDMVATVFTREDNIDTWNYLRSVAERVIADEGIDENLNPECNWCVRAATCETLSRHVEGGGRLGLGDDLGALVERRAQLENQRAGLAKVIESMDDMIFTGMEEGNLGKEFATETIKVEITSQKRRYADSERVTKIIGPELAAEYGKIGVTAIDELMKDNRLTKEQRADLDRTIRNQYTNPRIKTTAISPHDDNEPGRG